MNALDYAITPAKSTIPTITTSATTAAKKEPLISSHAFLSVSIKKRLSLSLSCRTGEGPPAATEREMVPMQPKFILCIHSGLKLLCRCVNIILRNNRAEGRIPDHILSELARCFARDIPAFFADPANQEAYKRWLQARKQQSAQAAPEKGCPGSLQKINDGGTV